MSRTKVLLADRSATIQRIVSMALEGEPLDVIVASSGEEALEKLRSERPDILLVDMRLPDMNGIELCRTLRTDPAWEPFARLPVVVMMGIYDTMQSDQQESIQEQARAAGANDILVKPFDPKELIQKIHTLVPPTTGEPLEVVPSGDVPEPVETPPVVGEAPIPMEPGTAEPAPAVPAEEEGQPEVPVETAPTTEEPTVALSEEERVCLLSEAGVAQPAEDVAGPEPPVEELPSELFASPEASAEPAPEGPAVPAPAGEEPLPDFAWDEDVPASHSGDTETVIMPAPDLGPTPPETEAAAAAEEQPETGPEPQPIEGTETRPESLFEPIFAPSEEPPPDTSGAAEEEEVFKLEDTYEEPVADDAPFDVWATDTTYPETAPEPVPERPPAQEPEPEPAGPVAAPPGPEVVRQKTLELESEETAVPPGTDIEALVEALLRNERFIERLAQKIVAHLSQPLLEDIAWQILPDLADRMLRQKVAESPPPGPSSPEGE